MTALSQKPPEPGTIQGGPISAIPGQETAQGAPQYVPPTGTSQDYNPATRIQPAPANFLDWLWQGSKQRVQQAVERPEERAGFMPPPMPSWQQTLEDRENLIGGLGSFGQKVAPAAAVPLAALGQVGQAWERATYKSPLLRGLEQFGAYATTLLGEPALWGEQALGAGLIEAMPEAEGLSVEEWAPLTLRTYSYMGRALEQELGREEGEALYSPLKTDVERIQRGEVTAEEAALQRESIAAELVGQVIADPLNLIDALGVWKAFKQGKALKASQQLVAEAVDATPEARRAVLAMANVLGVEADQAVEILGETVTKAGRKADGGVMAKIRDAIANPFDLTPTAKAERDTGQMWIVLGGPLSETRSGDEALAFVADMIEDPERLRPIFGDSMVSEAGSKTRLILTDIADGIGKLPEAQKPEGMFNPARFVMELEDLALDRLRKAYGHKEPNKYLQFANAWKGLMSEFYLTALYSPGYAMRNTATDLVTAAADGILNFDRVEDIDNYLDALGSVTTRRVTTGGAGQLAELTGIAEEAGQVGEKVYTSRLPGPLGAISKLGQKIVREAELGRFAIGEEPRYKRALVKATQQMLDANAVRLTPAPPASVMAFFGPRADDLLHAVARGLNMDEKRATVARFLNPKGPGDLLEPTRYLDAVTLDAMSPEIARLTRERLTSLPPNATQEEIARAFEDLHNMVADDTARRLKDLEDLPATREVATDVEEAEVAEPVIAELERIAADHPEDPEIARIVEETKAKVPEREAELAEARTAAREGVEASNADSLEVLIAANLSADELRDASRVALDDLRRRVVKAYQANPAGSGGLWRQYAEEVAQSWDLYSRRRIDRFVEARDQLARLGAGEDIGEVLGKSRRQLAEERLRRASEIPPAPENWVPGRVLDAQDNEKFELFLAHHRGRVDRAQVRALRASYNIEPGYHGDVLDLLDSASRDVEIYGQRTAGLVAEARDKAFKDAQAAYARHGGGNAGKRAAQYVWEKYWAERNDLWAKYHDRAERRWMVAERDALLARFERAEARTAPTPKKIQPGDQALVKTAALKNRDQWTAEEVAAVERWTDTGRRMPTTAEVVKAEIAANAPLEYSREEWRQDLQTFFGLSGKDRSAIMAITDARAKTWAEQTGRPAAEWYKTRLAGMRRGIEGESRLMQVGRGDPELGQIIDHNLQRWAAQGGQDLDRAKIQEATWQILEAGRDQRTLELDLGDLGELDIMERVQAEDAARNYLQSKATMILESARPGIQSEAKPGNVILYRTERSPKQVIPILASAEAGDLGGGFTSSVAHIKQKLRQLADRATRRGQSPVYVSNYPSVAGFYQEWKASYPITFAMEVPESAILYTSPRAAAEAGTGTQGIAYSLTFVDTELIVDAKQIERLWIVPDELIQDTITWAKSIADEHLVKGAFKNTYKDRDPELVAAAAEAIRDLRKPPASLERPFIETPVYLKDGLQIQKGDRVVLINGEVVTAKSYREADWERFGKFLEPGTTAYIGTTPIKGAPLSWSGLAGYQTTEIPDTLIVKVLKKGDRITKDEIARLVAENHSTMIERYKIMIGQLTDQIEELDGEILDLAARGIHGREELPPYDPLRVGDPWGRKQGLIERLEKAQEMVHTYKAPTYQPRLFQKGAGPTPVWYNKLETVLEQKLPQRVRVDQLRDMLDPPMKRSKKGALYKPSPPVKGDEIEYSGILRWLDGWPEETISKQEVMEYLKSFQVKVKDVTFGGKADPTLEIRHSQALAEYDRVRAMVGERASDYGSTEGILGAIEWHEERILQIDQEGQQYGTYRDAIRFAEQEPELTRQLLDAYADLTEARLMVDEAQDAGSTRWETFTLPGGKNYTEWLIEWEGEPTPPPGYKITFDSDLDEWYWERPDMEGAAFGNRRAALEGAWQDAAEKGLTSEVRRQAAKYPKKYQKMAHWGYEENVIVHSRFDERATQDGRRMLFIDELQSDWHQDARKQGYLHLWELEDIDAEKARIGELFQKYGTFSPLHDPMEGATPPAQRIVRTMDELGSREGLATTAIQDTSFIEIVPDGQKMQAETHTIRLYGKDWNKNPFIIWESKPVTAQEAIDLIGQDIWRNYRSDAAGNWRVTEWPNPEFAPPQNWDGKTRVQIQVEGQPWSVRNGWQELQRARSATQAQLPKAPYADTRDWTALAFKRMLREAAEQDMEALGWTTGHVHGVRWRQRHLVDDLSYDPRTRTLRGFREGMGEVFREEKLSPKDLYDVLGKDIADDLLENDLGSETFREFNKYDWERTDDGYLEGQKITAGMTNPNQDIRIYQLEDGTVRAYIDEKGLPTDVRSYASMDEAVDALRQEYSVKRTYVGDYVGGRGYQTYYDEILPSVAKKELKRWGVEPREEPNWRLQSNAYQDFPDYEEFILEESSRGAWDVIGVGRDEDGRTDFDQIRTFLTEQEAMDYIYGPENPPYHWVIPITPQMKADLLGGPQSLFQMGRLQQTPNPGEWRFSLGYKVKAEAPSPTWGKTGAGTEALKITNDASLLLLEHEGQWYVHAPWIGYGQDFGPVPDLAQARQLAERLAPEQVPVSYNTYDRLGNRVSSWTSTRAAERDLRATFSAIPLPDDFPERAPGIITRGAAEANDFYLYRGISKGELDYIIETGQIKSRGEYNFSFQDPDATFFGEAPGTGYAYAGTFAPPQYQPTAAAPGYVLEVKRGDWAKAEYRTGDVYSTGPVPADQIVRVTEIRPGPTPDADWIARDVTEAFTLSIEGGRPLLQRPKGAIDFLDDGRAVISAFESGDISTVVHELGHIFRRDLEGEELRIATRWATGLDDAEWTVEAEEKFARAFERYLREGQAPSQELKNVFAHLKDWLIRIYKNLTGSDIDVPIDPNIRGVFDRLLESDPEIIRAGDPRGRELAWDRIARWDEAQDAAIAPTIPLDLEQARQEYGLEGDALVKALEDRGNEYYINSTVDEIRQQVKKQAYHRLDEPKYREQFGRTVEITRDKVLTDEQQRVLYWELQGVKAPAKGDQEALKVAKKAAKAFRDEQAMYANWYYSLASEAMGGDKAPAPPEEIARVALEQIERKAQTQAALEGGEIQRPPEVVGEAPLDLRKFARPAEGMYQAEGARPVFGQPERKPGQMQMFEGGEDLPLMSGTAPQAEAPQFVPPEAAPQGMLPGMAPELGDAEKYAARPAGAAPPAEELRPKRVPKGQGTLWQRGTQGRHPWEDAAIRIFGVTNDPNEAGYILKDGTMLDFSGRSRGSREERIAGQRTVPHNEISAAIREVEGIDRGMIPQPEVWFTGQTGAVKLWSVTPSQGGQFGQIWASNPLTESQRNVITRLVKETGTELDAYVFDPITGHLLGRTVIENKIDLGRWFRSIDELITDDLLAMANDEGRTMYQRGFAQAGQAEPPTLRGMVQAGETATHKALDDIQAGITQDWHEWQPQIASQQVKADAANWLENEVQPAWYDLRATALQYGKTRADDALLNYRNRRNFDTWLSYIAPYHYWFTRSGWNWAQRLALHPGLLNHYLMTRDAMQQANENAGRRQRFATSVKVPFPWLPDWAGDAVYVDPLRFMLPFANIFGNNWDDADESAQGLQRIWNMTQDIGLRPYHFLELPYKAGWLAKAGEALGMETEKAQQLLGPEYGGDYGYMLPQTRAVKAFTAGQEWAPPGGLNIEGPLRQLAGLPAGEIWDTYRINRTLANMSALDPTNQQLAQRALLAQELMQRDTQQTGAAWTAGSELAQQVAAELNIPPEEIAAAQQMLQQAADQAAQEQRAGVVGWALGPSMKIEPSGERAQLEMAEEARGLTYPESPTGSRAAYEQYKRETPAMYPRSTQYQALPGEEAGQGMAPGARRNWLALREVKDQINDQANRQIDEFLKQRPWDGQGVSEINNQRYQALDAAKAQYPLPEFTGEIPPILYGQNPAEMWNAVTEDQLYDLQATKPSPDTFTDPQSGEIDWANYYAAVDQWKTTIPDNLIGEPIQAGTYQGMSGPQAYDAFTRRNHSILQAAHEIYQEQVISPTWDAYHAIKGQPNAYNQTVGAVPQIKATQLIPAIQRVYGFKGWTQAQLQQELAGVIFPPMADQQAEKRGTGTGTYRGASGGSSDFSQRVAEDWRSVLGAPWWEKYQRRGGRGGGGRTYNRSASRTEQPRWVPPPNVYGGPFRGG